MKTTSTQFTVRYKKHPVKSFNSRAAANCYLYQCQENDDIKLQIRIGIFFSVLFAAFLIFAL